MLPVKSVLWPTDGSKPSFSALEKAVAICRANNAKLYALQVIAEVPLYATGMVGSSVTPHGFDAKLYEQELIKMTQQQMEDMVGKQIPDDLDLKLQVLAGNPPEMINFFADENDIDVIVMATQGRTGMSHLLLGSVAEKTIRQATRPVLVIPGGDDGEGDNQADA